MNYNLISSLINDWNHLFFLGPSVIYSIKTDVAKWFDRLDVSENSPSKIYFEDFIK